jgi:hypothetical protein
VALKDLPQGGLKTILKAAPNLKKLYIVDANINQQKLLDLKKEAIKEAIIEKINAFLFKNTEDQPQELFEAGQDVGVGYEILKKKIYCA